MANEIDFIKVSANTRKLVAQASLSHQAMVADLSYRFKRGDNVNAIVEDVLVARISLALKHADDNGKNAKQRAERVTFEQAALLLIGKKTFGSQGDDVRTKVEQDYLDAAKKWLNRARRDAGFPSEDKRGAAGRDAAKDKGEAGKQTIVAAPATTNAPVEFSVPKFVIPKPKASADVTAIIAALASAANKALSEGADGALNGDVGMIARDALVAMVAAGSKFEAARLALVAKEPNAPKGAKRAAVTALSKTMEHAPVAEILN